MNTKIFDNMIKGLDTDEDTNIIIFCKSCDDFSQVRKSEDYKCFECQEKIRLRDEKIK